MDTNNTVEINSCLMQAMVLETPVDLCYCFKDEDLIYAEPETHVTLLWAPGVMALPSRVDEMNALRTILPADDFQALINFIEEGSYLPEDWFGKIFKLDSFNNDDGDYLILKLDPENPYGEWMMKVFKLINKGFKNKWEVEASKFPYNPHITLAKLEKGTAQKYIDSPSFNKILEDSNLGWSDVILSIGETGKEDDHRKQIYLTNFHAVERYFELNRARKIVEECKGESGYIVTQRDFSMVVEQFTEEKKTVKLPGEKPKTIEKTTRKKLFDK